MFLPREAWLARAECRSDTGCAHSGSHCATQGHGRQVGPGPGRTKLQGLCLHERGRARQGWSTGTPSATPRASENPVGEVEDKMPVPEYSPRDLNCKCARLAWAAGARGAGMRVRRSRRPGRGRDTRSLCAERQDAAEGRELAVAAAGVTLRTCPLALRPPILRRVTKTNTQEPTLRASQNVAAIY